MNINRIIKYGIAIVGSRLLNYQRPVFTSIALTNRCNSHCLYCNIYSLTEKELSTKEVFSIIERLAQANCLRLGLTGGEPLLRRDLGLIINYALSKKIDITVASNGTNISKHVKTLEKISLLKISYDGPKEIHDITRGAGSYETVEEAIDIAKKHKIPVCLVAVISKINSNHLMEMVSFAKQQNLNIEFQFAERIEITNNNNENLFLSTKEKDNCIKLLRGYKKIYRNIVNTTAGLKILQERRTDLCVAGKIFFRISAQGMLLPCWRQLDQNMLDIKWANIGESIRLLRVPLCNGCTIADGAELSAIYHLKVFTLLEYFIKLFRKRI